MSYIFNDYLLCQFGDQTLPLDVEIGILSISLQKMQKPLNSPH